MGLGRIEGSVRGGVILAVSHNNICTLQIARRLGAKFGLVLELVVVFARGQATTFEKAAGLSQRGMRAPEQAGLGRG